MNTVPESLIQQFFKDGCVLEGLFLQGKLLHGELLEEKLFSSEMARFSPENHFAILSAVLERAMLNPNLEKSQRAAELLHAVSMLKCSYGAFYIELCIDGTAYLLREVTLIRMDSAYKLPAYK